jgi:hypothetical protein
MTDIVIKQPHAGSTLEDLIETWESLMFLDRTDETLAAEVLHQLLPDPDDDLDPWPPCPYPEGSPQYLDWCAEQFAAMIGASTYRHLQRRFDAIDEQLRRDLDALGLDDDDDDEEDPPPRQRVSRPKRDQR